MARSIHRKSATRLRLSAEIRRAIRDGRPCKDALCRVCKRNSQRALDREPSDNIRPREAGTHNRRRGAVRGVRNCGERCMVLVRQKKLSEADGVPIAKERRPRPRERLTVGRASAARTSCAARGGWRREKGQ